jgi:asparagine synthase (glutamine-hydrolysing)
VCGIAGFWNSNGLPEDIARDTLTKMTDSIRHRGPDDAGFWYDRSAGIAMGHRRLSVVDLSPAGHQPMLSQNTRFVMVFNGEIYNHLEIRQEIDNTSKIAWRGSSDTETLLAAIQIWGLERTLHRTVGMFSFALWDRDQRALSLVRDRMGEKPLYYGWQGTGRARTFLFGSELKALRANNAFSASIDRNALSLYMRTGYVPAPWSIYDGIHKLAPGCIAVIKAGVEVPQIQNYWSAEKVAVSGALNPMQIRPQEAVDQLEELLKSSIRQQMLADVPVGAFLSGGIDSSTIVALMQNIATQSVKTFSIGFEDAEFNEAQHASAVASHLKTNHTEFYVTSAEALKVIPQLPEIYDEPFGDSSQIPTYLVSKMASRDVTVALSGDAGDELFCGYSRYFFTDSLWAKINVVPRALRLTCASAIDMAVRSPWNASGELSDHGGLGGRLRRAANVLRSREIGDVYVHTVSQWANPDCIVEGAREPITLLTGAKSDLDQLSPLQKIMAYDMLTYLPGDILTKVDRAAMAVSLETRIPMLDHRVVEFACRLPIDVKYRDGISKWVLRQVLYRHLPKEMMERPKMGFGVPLDSWLRGPLRDWAEDLFTPQRLGASGLRKEPILSAWAEHLSGKRDRQYALWNVLSYLAWEKHRDEAN